MTNEVTLKDALRDAEQRLAAAKDESDKFLIEIKERMEGLATEIRGLQLAMHRHNGTAPTGATPQPDIIEWRVLRRTIALLTLMATLSTPSSPAALAAMLRKRGRDDEAPVISATLNHLRKQGNVTNHGGGSWVITYKGRSKVEKD